MYKNTEKPKPTEYTNVFSFVVKVEETHSIERGRLSTANKNKLT